MHTRELAAIQYYLHVAISKCQSCWSNCHHGITNHATLIREIERWRFETNEKVCFVTFNYDTMLENAMVQVLDLPFFDDLDKYISHSDYSLVKLHGSVNWGREVDGIRTEYSSNTFASLRTPVSQQSLIRDAFRLGISDRYRVVSSCPMFTHEGQYVYPALAIPVENKDEFLCPQTHIDKLVWLESHRSGLSEAVAHLDTKANRLDDCIGGHGGSG